MTFEHSAKNKKVLLFISLIILMAGIFLVFYSSVVFQEGNPWPQIKGIVRLNLGGEAVVKLDIGENKYITKSNNSEIIKSFMEDRGYKFTEQMGSGYFFESKTGAGATATHRYYSRFYSLWTINETESQISWLDYKNDEFGFAFRYPSLAVDNQLWGNLTEILPAAEVLLPNQVLSQDNNFYRHQKYSLARDEYTGKILKTENTFMPEYDGSHGYPTPWHIVIFDVKDMVELDKIIKTKLGSGCSYKNQIPMEFKGNYRVEINGDGKDLGETQCPVNYANYIIYSPDWGKVAFWSTGQECQIGLGFMAENCFDQEISESFHFFQAGAAKKILADELKSCLPKSDLDSQEKCARLLRQIINFDSCVEAGFLIMKSNPSQCSTPDGRTFVE